MVKYKLGDICEIVSGSTPKTSVENYWDGDIKWITPAEINDDTYIINDSVRKITELGVKKTGLSPFPEGTIILSSRAPIGKVAIAGCEMYCNQGFKNLICSDKIYNKYLYWFLKGNTAFLNSLGRGATFKEISKAIVSEIEINVPNIEHQKEAVGALEKVSGVISLRKKELLALDKLIKARFVEMFGDPVVHLYKGETVKLDTVADKITVGFVGEASNEYADEGVPYLRTQNVRVNRIDLNGLIYVNEAFHNKNQKSIIHPGDVVISRVGVNRGMAAMIPDSLPEANIANCLIVGQTDNINSYYLAFYMNMSFGKRPQFGASVGSAQGVINTSILKKWEVYVPDKKLQDDFFEFSSQIDKSKFIDIINLLKILLFFKRGMYYGN